MKCTVELDVEQVLMLITLVDDLLNYDGTFNPTYRRFITVRQILRASMYDHNEEINYENIP